MRNSRLIYGDTRFNQKYLADDYVQTLQDSYDQVMLDAYLKGLFINMLSNRFYYSHDPHRNEVKGLSRIPGLEVVVMLDYNVDPMCATIGHIVTLKDRRTGGLILDNTGRPVRKLLCFDEIEIGGRLAGAKTENMADALKERGYHPDETIVYPDPAGKARSTNGEPNNVIMMKAGFRIKTRNVAPQFRRRQLAVNNLLDKGLIQYNPDTCPGLKRDFENVEQDTADLSKVKDNPKLTHFSDGLDYLVDLEFPLSGTKPNSGSARIR